MVVLDTDHLTLLQRSSSVEGERLRRRLEVVPDSERAATIVSFEEQVRGRLADVARSWRHSERLIQAFLRLRQLLEIYCRLQVLAFDAHAATHYAQLQSFRRIGAKDLQIAAIALANQATVLTRNTKDFTQVPGLRVEDWTRDPEGES